MHDGIRNNDTDDEAWDVIKSLSVFDIDNSARIRIVAYFSRLTRQIVNSTHDT